MCIDEQGAQIQAEWTVINKIVHNMTPMVANEYVFYLYYEPHADTYALCV